MDWYVSVCGVGELSWGSGGEGWSASPSGPRLKLMNSLRTAAGVSKLQLTYQSKHSSAYLRLLFTKKWRHDDFFATQIPAAKLQE
jgi:hypothetical protein